jgi:hypothetical protein
VYFREVQRHVASAEISLELDHECFQCQTVSAVMARGAGSHSPAPVLMGSREEAVEGAARAAQDDAALMNELARCPSCGKRNGFAVRGYLFRCIRNGVLIAVPLAIVGKLIDMDAPGQQWTWTLAFAGAAVGAFVVRFVWKLLRSDRAITLVAR